MPASLATAKASPFRSVASRSAARASDPNEMRASARAERTPIGFSETSTIEISPAAVRCEGFGTVMNNFGSVVALFQGGSGDPRTAAERLGDLLEWYGAVGDLASGNPRGFATRKASLAHALARTAERPEDERHAVALAGVLHAVGALENPGLRKGEALPERLARMERWDIPAQGARLCARIAALPHAVADLVRWQAE